MATKKTEVSFEENIKQLEGIVNKLEGGDVSLDEMLELFEEGIRRTKECTSQLKNAEQKITVLMKNSDGEICEAPFEVE
ncbi:MAG: exodeoxyribonuclease VII small subunit [Clostridia bacterium]|nr:exodeoxyribonuclease VII small subunit [Clostridia bacterium]